MGGPAPIGRTRRHSPPGETWASGRERGRDHHNCHVEMDETATTRQQNQHCCLASRSAALPHSGSGAAGAVTGDERNSDAAHHAAQSALGDQDDGDASEPLLLQFPQAGLGKVQLRHSSDRLRRVPHSHGAAAAPRPRSVGPPLPIQAPSRHTAPPPSCSVARWSETAPQGRHPCCSPAQQIVYPLTHCHAHLRGEDGRC